MMQRPPPDPRYHRALDEPTWGSILTSYALIAAIPLLLWAVSRPLAGAVVLAAIVGLFVGARRAVRLVRRISECREFTVDFGRNVRITITRRCICDTN